ncbi:MAG: hypothetical protein N0C90_12870 [Candidatus Thiodiazotropha endolucinida]|nr:hypothetical protein [Candidatus Thiodiazotropha taylori]MCW4262253.1 hypothetical protein [Candidatus Thiodiazotropha endolucinida]
MENPHDRAMLELEHIKEQASSIGIDMSMSEIEYAADGGYLIKLNGENAIYADGLSNALDMLMAAGEVLKLIKGQMDTLCPDAD